MRILVTGSNGFIGKNLVSRLNEIDTFKVLTYTRGDHLPDFSKIDFIFHLAGENRPKNPSDFEKNNAIFTKELCDLVRESKKNIPIIFTSSVQAELDNPYGRSKKDSENSLRVLFDETENPVQIFRLPNVFGKWSRPNYNSVVSTFCFNIANNLPIKINSESKVLKLIYIDDLISFFLQSLYDNEAGFFMKKIKPDYEITIKKLAEIIFTFKEIRETLVIPDVGKGLVRALYSTYLSYLTPNDFVYDVPSNVDKRGVFVEMIKTHECGQISFFTAHPGVTRGGHYHHSKSEKFLVINGEANFRFKNIISNELYEIHTSGKKPQIVETVPGWSHDITNIGKDEMIVMLWANEIYNHNYPDTIVHEV